MSATFMEQASGLRSFLGAFPNSVLYIAHRGATHQTTVRPHPNATAAHFLQSDNASNQHL